MIYRNQIVWVLSHCSTSFIFNSKITTSSFDSGWGDLSKMKTIHILCIATSMLASSTLFAETTQPQQVGETTSKAQPYGDNPSLGRVLLYKTGKGIQNLGDSIQGASEKPQIKLAKSGKTPKNLQLKKQKSSSKKQIQPKLLQKIK